MSRGRSQNLEETWVGRVCSEDFKEETVTEYRPCEEDGGNDPDCDKR